MPEIIIKQPIYDDDAKRFQKCFTPGVIELEVDQRGESLKLASELNDELQNLLM